MDKVSKNYLENLVRAVLFEKLSERQSVHKAVDESGILSIKLPLIEVSEENRLDTGNEHDQVYCKDLVTLSESPRLGCGLMVMKKTSFAWTLAYDEVNYVIDGNLSILIDNRKITASSGEIIFIPKGSSIQFSVPEEARFLYVTYPADWATK